MPEANYKPRKTLKTVTKTAAKRPKGCRARCNEAYEIGSEEWEQCMRNCQAGKTIG